MPAHSPKSARFTLSGIYQEREELGLLGIIYLPVLPDVTAEDALLAFFLHFDHSHTPPFRICKPMFPTGRSVATWSEGN